MAKNEPKNKSPGLSPTAESILIDFVLMIVLIAAVLVGFYFL